MVIDIKKTHPLQNIMKHIDKLADQEKKDKEIVGKDLREIIEEPLKLNQEFWAATQDALGFKQHVCPWH